MKMKCKFIKWVTQCREYNRHTDIKYNTNIPEFRGSALDTSVQTPKIVSKLSALCIINSLLKPKDFAKLLQKVVENSRQNSRLTGLIWSGMRASIS